MPPFVSGPFLLWHDAAVSGDWGKLLRMRAKKDAMLAAWMLQSFPVSPQRSGGESAGSFVDRFMAA
jgi:hypothetical protein